MSSSSQLTFDYEYCELLLKKESIDTLTEHPASLLLQSDIEKVNKFYFFKQKNLTLFIAYFCSQKHSS